MGYITRDGSLLLTNVAGVSGGQVSGAYEYEDGTTYYTWPISQGAPAKQYEGIIRRAGYYSVPVVASVHTHTPCRRDGTDGVSHPVGDNDEVNADTYRKINHWVIGCGVVAQYDHNYSYFFNKHYGDLASICSYIK